MNTKEFSKELIKLGTRIKQIREHRSYSLRKLQTLTGIDYSDLAKYERGEVNLTLHTLCKIAKALKVEVYELTNYSGPLPE